MCYNEDWGWGLLLKMIVSQRNSSDFLLLRSSDKSSDQLLEILRVISQMQESSHPENKRFEKL